jgi:RNA-splicing ligase RtcB
VEEVVGAAVERGGGDDLVAGAGQGEDGERLGGLAGGRGERGRAAFERGDALLEDVGGGVHDAGVDVAELLEAEEAAGVVGIVEDVGGGLVDGHGARVGGGVGDLAGVNCERGKMLTGKQPG